MQYLKYNYIIYDDLYVASVKPYPKKANLSNSNNWRRITLLDIVLKITSIFLNTRLQKMIEVRGTLSYFSTTPKLQYQDTVFILKSFLQEYGESIIYRSSEDI